MSRLQPESGSDLGEVVAQLVKDVETLNTELYNVRWETVANNFRQITENFAQLNRRLEELERAHKGGT